MPSKTFQPLLFDSFKYKLPNTTYVDHYGRKYKKRASSSLSRTLSQKEKSAVLTQRSRPFTSSHMSQLENKYIKKYNVNFNPIVSIQEINRVNSAITPLADESIGTQVQVVTQIENKPHVRFNSPPPARSPNNQEIPRSFDDLSDQQLADMTENLLRMENKKHESAEDKSHWLTYKQEETPEYIIEAKKRLNQVKQPNLTPDLSKQQRAKSAVVKSTTATTTPTSTVPKNLHWICWDNPSTPENVREIRRRLGDDRYRKQNLLKSSLQRCKTYDDINSYTAVEYAPRAASPVPVTEFQPNSVNVHTNVLYPNGDITSNIRIDDTNAKVAVSYSPTNEIAFDPSYRTDNVTAYATNPDYYMPLSDGNYFKSNTDKYINYSVDDLLQSGNPTEMPFTDWMLNANDSDKDAMLRALNQAESNANTRTYISSPSRSFNDYNNAAVGNQYVTLKKKNYPILTASLARQQTPPLRLRSLIDTRNPNSTSAIGRPSSTNVRKLGSVRKTLRFKDEENLEQFLKNANPVVANQMIGNSTIHYGYNC